MVDLKYLKHSYKSRLYTVLIINVALFWVTIVSKADLSTVPTVLSSLSIKDGVAGLIGPIAAFVLDGLLSADAKARIVYGRCLHPLPGSRAFSVHLPREPRADPHRLTKKWGTFPSAPIDQNRLWYRIYMSVDGQLRVQEAHRAWLFSRDLTAYSAIILVFLGLATLLTGAPWSIASVYLLGLVIQFLAAMMAARTYGVRFVCTVLAVASQDIHDEAETVA